MGEAGCPAEGEDRARGEACRAAEVRMGERASCSTVTVCTQTLSLSVCTDKDLVCSVLVKT